MPCEQHQGSTPGDWIRDSNDQRIYRELEKKTHQLEAALCATIRWQGFYKVLDAMAQNGESDACIKAIQEWYKEHEKEDKHK